MVIQKTIHTHIDEQVKNQGCEAALDYYESQLKNACTLGDFQKASSIMINIIKLYKKSDKNTESLIKDLHGKKDFYHISHRMKVQYDIFMLNKLNLEKSTESYQKLFEDTLKYIDSAESGLIKIREFSSLASEMIRLKDRSGFNRVFSKIKEELKDLENIDGACDVVINMFLYLDHIDSSMNQLLIDSCYDILNFYSNDIIKYERLKRILNFFARLREVKEINNISKSILKSFNTMIIKDTEDPRWDMLLHLLQLNIKIDDFELSKYIVNIIMKKIHGFNSTEIKVQCYKNLLDIISPAESMDITGKIIHSFEREIEYVDKDHLSIEVLHEISDVYLKAGESDKAKLYIKKSLNALEYCQKYTLVYDMIKKMNFLQMKKESKAILNRKIEEVKSNTKPIYKVSSKEDNEVQRDENEILFLKMCVELLVEDGNLDKAIELKDWIEDYIKNHPDLFFANSRNSYLNNLAIELIKRNQIQRFMDNIDTIYLDLRYNKQVDEIMYIIENMLKNGDKPLAEKIINKLSISSFGSRDKLLVHIENMYKNGYKQEALKVVDKMKDNRIYCYFKLAESFASERNWHEIIDLVNHQKSLKYKLELLEHSIKYVSKGYIEEFIYYIENSIEPEVKYEFYNLILDKTGYLNLNEMLFVLGKSDFRKDTMIKILYRYGEYLRYFEDYNLPWVKDKVKEINEIIAL